MKRLNTLFLSLLMTGMLCMSIPFTFNGRAGGDNNEIILQSNLEDKSLSNNITAIYTYPLITCNFAQDFEALDITINNESNTTYYHQNSSANTNTPIFINVENYPNGIYSLIIKNGQGGTAIGHFTVEN